jgi:hypothetical protein
MLEERDRLRLRRAADDRRWEEIRAEIIKELGNADNGELPAGKSPAGSSFMKPTGSTRR